MFMQQYYNPYVKNITNIQPTFDAGLYNQALETYSKINTHVVCKRPAYVGGKYPKLHVFHHGKRENR